MAYLKVYQWEHETWPEFQKIEISREDVKSYLKKFARHFKIDIPYLSNSHKRGKHAGVYYQGSFNGTIVLTKECTFGIVIHEFAHHLTRMRHGTNHHHGKKFKRELKRVYTFAKRYIK